MSIGINNVSISSFSSFSRGRIIPARDGSANCKRTSLLEIPLRISTKRGALKPILIGSLRIATGVLNEIMMEAVAMQQPPSDKGKRLKLYYITQVVELYSK